MSRIALVGLLAFAVSLSGTAAYADVQNVKVSGDIDMKFISHNNYDLKNKQGNISGVTSPTVPNITPVVTNDDNSNFFLSTVRVKVDADLTDNVSTSVRLLNQRVWDADVHTASNDTSSIVIDNAYVVLKEFLYSPLTVIAGRQNLKYGTGFIVGDGLLSDPNGVFTSAGSGASTLTGIGREYSAFNAFDAIRAILDFSPITIDAVFAQINETGVAKDDQILVGGAVNYKLDRWAAEIEPYYFYKQDQGASLAVADVSGVNGTGRVYEGNYVNTTGLRLAASPIENLMLNAEGAWQFGRIVDTTTTAGFTYQTRRRQGLAATVDGRYKWAQVPWTPTTGGGWVYYSGATPTSVADATRDHKNKFTAWDSMYRGSFTTYIQDFLAGNDGGGLYTTFAANDTSASTNRHLLYGDVGLKPLQDLTLWARYTHVWFARPPRVGRSTQAGDEIDAKLVYDYTEDVSLSAFGGWFIPGRFYSQQTDSNLRGDDLAWTAGAGAAVKF